MRVHTVQSIDERGVQIIASGKQRGANVYRHYEVFGGVYRAEQFADVHFQQGDPAKVGINGCTNEDLLKIVRDRLYGQNEKCPCRANEQSLRKLEQILDILAKRTMDRRRRGVLGTDKP